MPSRSLISSAVSVSILSSLRSPLVHPRPNLGDSRVDLFERIAQRGQRFEQVVPVKASKVGGASVPAVLKKGQPGPHPGGPLRPAGSVAGSRLNVPDMPCKDMEPGIQISLRACGEPALLRVVRTSVDPAVDLFDLLSEVAKQGQRFRLQERNRHGDHGQGQNTAGVLDGLVRVGDYGVDGSSHVLLQKKESPFRGYFGSRGSVIHLIFHASRISLALCHPIDLTICDAMPSHSAWYGGAPIYRP